MRSKSAPVGIVVALVVTMGGGTGCATGGPARRGATFGSLGELVGAVEKTSATGDAEDLWQRVMAAGAMPLVFGRTAAFFYRGPGETVEWRGDFSSWAPDGTTSGERLGTTDVWWRLVQLEPDARLDYKLVLDGETWLLDPLNSHVQVGGFGPNSEARMPGWRPSPWVSRDSGAPRGDFGDEEVVDSQVLGYPVTIRVYTSVGLDATAGRAPSLYVTDGSDYWRDEMGAMVTVLDTLGAAGLIEPVVVVFVDPWDQQRRENRRERELVPAGPDDCPFGEFLVRELIPRIDASYPTDPTAGRRALLGASLGGLFSTYMAVVHPETFGMAAIQSPIYDRTYWVLQAVRDAEQLPAKVFVSAGLYEPPFLDSARTVTAVLGARHEVELLSVETSDGHSWGQWRALLDEVLQFFFVSPRPAAS